MTKLLILIASFTTLSLSSFAQTGHWEKLEPKTNPGSRGRHCMAPIGKHKVLLFGGSVGGYCANDTWIFDLDKCEWQKIICKDSPSPRKDFGMTQMSENRVYLFGGVCEEDSAYAFNDWWYFDLDSMNWIQVINNDGFSKRYDHRLAKLNDNEILMYGGNSAGPIYENVDAAAYLYNIIENKWSDPWAWLSPGRVGHMMTNIADDIVYLYGGHFQGTGSLDNNSIYDGKIDNWVKMTDIIDNPIANALAGATQINNGVVIMFSGNAGDTNTEIHWTRNTWLFSFYEKKWTELKTGIYPEGRIFSQMAKIDTNKALLFGGYPASGPLLEDTWLFVLDSGYTSVDEFKPPQSQLNIRQSNDNEILIDYRPDKLSAINILMSDVTGRAIFRAMFDEGSPQAQIRIPTGGLAPGIYIIRLDCGAEILFGKVMVSAY